MCSKKEDVEKRKPFYTATQANEAFSKYFEYLSFHLTTHCKKCGEELLLIGAHDRGYSDWDTGFIYRCPNYKWWARSHATDGFYRMINPAVVYEEIERNSGKKIKMKIDY